MKKLILIPIIALIFASCSKQSIEQNRPAAQLATITFNQVSGGGTHIQFHVKLTTPVKKANLYQVPGKLVYYVSNPGLSFVMYHNGPDYPTYTQQVFYQLELIMEDGTKVLGDKFQVY